MNISRLVFILLAFSLFLSSANSNFAQKAEVSISRQSAKIYWRTELYFGRDKNDGTEVSDEEWYKFVDEVVTPKFPSGLTITDVQGQWQNNTGKIIKEKSKLLTLLYPAKLRKSSGNKIEQIRIIYKKMFNQQSVMRIDIRQNYIYF